jgi:nucleoside diphosphate kinase
LTFANSTDIVQYVQNKIPFTELEDFCFGIIKYDALALNGGEKLISERLKTAGLTICARKETTITPKQLDSIYAGTLDKPYYIPMRDSIVGKKAVCLIIGGARDVSNVVVELKGEVDKPGTIRGDLSYINQMTNKQYQAYLDGRYTHHPDTGRSIHDHIHMDDRFHSSGAENDSRRGISAVFSDAEIATIGQEYPAFKQFMSRG